jgi:sensor histidine kinase YesM
VKIDLSAHRSDEFLLLTLRNQIDQDLKVEGERIGLTNVRERLRLIYGLPDLLKTGIVPEKNEYVVTIKIPLKISGNGSI